MKSRWIVTLALLFSLVPDTAYPVTPTKGYNTVGDIRVKSVAPHNPLNRDQFRRRVFVRIQGRGRDVKVDLTIKGDPQHCQFPARNQGGNWEVASTQPCQFKVGGVPGKLWLPQAKALVEGEKMTLEGLAVVEWMGFKGTATFRLEGARDLALER